MHRVGVIAGGGALPKIIIDQLKNPFVLALQGHAHKDLKSHAQVGVTELKKAVDVLRANNIKTIVFAGKVARPSLSDIKLDTLGLKLLWNMVGAGDDALLSKLISFVEGLGFNVISAQDIVKNLLCKKGVLGLAKPTKQDLVDIKVGMGVLRALGDQDVGQGVVVENGYVLGIEAAEGTDGLIKRCGALKKEKAGVGVLVKLKKTMQGDKVDLPAVGEDTIKNLHKAGFKGVAIEAGGAILLDKNKIATLANKLKIFLIGV